MRLRSSSGRSTEGRTHAGRIYFLRASPVDSPVVIHLAGSSWCDGSYLIERSSSDLWVIEFVEAGTGTLEVDGRTCHPSAGDLYLAPFGACHRYYSSAESPWIKHWINFSGPLMPELLRLFKLEGIIHVPGFSRPELFKQALHQLRLHPQEAHSRIGPEFLMAVVSTMAADLRAADHRHRKNPEAQELRNWLDTQIFAPTPSLDEMATKISRSRGQTIRIFKSEYGETPVQYLIGRKIEAARELLRGSPVAIKRLRTSSIFRTNITSLPYSSAKPESLPAATAPGKIKQFFTDQLFIK